MFMPVGMCPVTVMPAPCASSHTAFTFSSFIELYSFICWKPFFL